MPILLVDSPLVGPSTWVPVTEVLTAVGHEVSVPDLSAAAKSGDPYMFIDAARPHVSAGTAVIAGHSGAGFFLPFLDRGRKFDVSPTAVCRRGDTAGVVQRRQAAFSSVGSARCRAMASCHAGRPGGVRA